MDPSFWHQRWERNEIGFHQSRVNTHLQEHWPSLHLAEDTAILVPLCGKSSDMLWLRSKGHRVFGVEISPIAVEQFFLENDLHPCVTTESLFSRWEMDGITILCGDFFTLETGDLAAVGAIYDRASLVALPQSMRSMYAKHLDCLVAANTPGLLIAMEYPQEQMQGPPFSVSQAEIRDLFRDAFELEKCESVDVLDEHPHLMERGLTQLTEHIYLLKSRG